MSKNPKGQPPAISAGKAKEMREKRLQFRSYRELGEHFDVSEATARKVILGFPPYDKEDYALDE